MPDFGKNETVFTVRTHLGHRLNPGDLALGYDLYSANMNDDDMYKALLRQNLAEVVLVMKNYEKKPHTRRWKLKRLPVEEHLGNKAKGEEEKREDECAKFLLELEREPELRFGINLNKNEDYGSEMASTIGDDVRVVPIEDLSLGEDEEDEGDEDSAHASMVE
jgi:nonsense-mediated mRNA decay protein 3